MWIENIMGQPAHRRTPAEVLQPPVRIDVAAGVRLQGSVTGSSDLSVDGEVDGQIELPGHVLTLGTHAKITAPVAARRVHIAGEVMGDVSSTEAVVVEATASIVGDIVAPTVAIAEGARFAGSIDMRGAAPGRASVTRLTPRVQIAV